jgi:hypothetical protein
MLADAVVPHAVAARARPKKKTAAELDAEMTDYFGGGGEAAAVAVADDPGMDGIS